MYLAVDVGGTKTLVASFSEDGKLFTKARFPTPKTYAQFLLDFKANIAQLGAETFAAAGVAIPGDIDRKHGIGLRYGNLTWKNNPVKADISSFTHCPVFVENDAKVAGLSEAILIKNEFKDILYITIGTGIGIAYIANGVVDTTFGDRGGTEVFVEHDGKQRVVWENLASGKAIQHRFGKPAKDITDEAIWKTIAHDLSIGLAQLVEQKHPDAVVFGGGAGEHFERYGDLVKQVLSEMLHGSVPAILPAKHPSEAALYGCVELIKQAHGQTT